MRTLIFLTMILASANASARDPIWLQVASSESGSIWEADFSNIRVVSDNYVTARKVWVKVDYSKDRSVSARSAKILFFIDCKNEKYRSSTWIEYKSDGTVLRDISSSYSSYKEIIPETVTQGLAEMVCSFPIDDAE